MGLRITEAKGVVVRNHWHDSNMSSAAVEMRRSHVWVLLEALEHKDRLSWSQRRLLASQIVYRHFLYLKELNESSDRGCVVAERTQPAPFRSFGWESVPYLLAQLSPKDTYPRLAGIPAYLVGKLSQKLL